MHLPPGSVLALYTDGLVQVRGSDVDEGIAELCQALAEGPEPLEELADNVMARMNAGGDDDAALLLLRVPDASVPARAPSYWRCRGSGR